MKKKLLLIVLLFITGIIYVRAATVDDTPPVIHSIKPVGSTFKQGDKIGFEVDAEDDISGINEILINFLYKGSTLFTQDQTDFMVVGLYKVQKFSNAPDGLNTFQNGKHVYYGYIPKTAKPGTYYFTRIHILDANRNTKSYCGTQDVCNTFKDHENGNFNFGNITIQKADIDNTPPQLGSLTVDKNNAKVGEKVRYEVEATDSSGIKNIEFFIGNAAYIVSNKTNGKYVLELEFSSPGVHTLNQLSISDVHNNRISYFYRSKYGQYTNIGSSFTLEDGKYDVTVVGDDGSTTAPKPELKKVTVSKSKLSAPGVVYVYVYANPHLRNSLILLNDDNPKALSGLHVTDMGWDGTRYVFKVTLNQYTQEGVYSFDLRLANELGEQVYYTYKDNYKLDIEVRKIPRTTFEVVKDYKADVTTSITNDKITEQIDNAKQGSVISIDTSKTTKIPSNIFSQIKGTSKTVVFESNGVQWHFKGNQITNPKDIDISTNIYFVEKYESKEETDENDEETWNNTRALVIEFPNNGNLPGKALIKIKVDYVFRDYLGSDDLYLYYKNGDSYDVISEKLQESKDGFYKFYINHNSTYYLSSKPLSKKKIKKNYTKELGNTELVKTIEEEVKHTNTTDVIENKTEIKKEVSKIITKTNISPLLMYGIPVIFILLVLILIIVIIKNKKNQSVKKGD